MFRLGGLCAQCDARGPPSGGGAHGSGDTASQRAPVPNSEEQQSGAHPLQHTPALPSHHSCQQEEQTPHRYLPPQPLMLYHTCSLCPAATMSLTMYYWCAERDATSCNFVTWGFGGHCAFYEYQNLKQEVETRTATFPLMRSKINKLSWVVMASERLLFSRKLMSFSACYKDN